MITVNFSNEEWAELVKIVVGRANELSLKEESEEEAEKIYDYWAKVKSKAIFKNNR